MTVDVETTNIPGVLVLRPRVFADSRGFFLESFRARDYRDYGVSESFVQENLSRSARNVLRGLHFQVQRPQAQIMTVVSGAIFDVAVDLRAGSRTFGEWFGLELHDTGVRQLYTPPGVAHGYCVLSDWADLHYKVSRYYDASDEGGVRWNDPEIGIDWPVKEPDLSSRDAGYPLLAGLSRRQLPQDPPIERVK